MIPTLKKIGKEANSPLEVLNENTSHFYPYWHYHPQYEIMLIEKGTGTRYVGDSISQFGEGDITIMGSNIPHLFRSDPEYFDPRSLRKAKATVLYFSDEFIDGDFFGLREAGAIRELMNLSQRGLIIQGPSKAGIARKLNRVAKGDGMQRLIDILSLLHYIASEGEYEVLSSLGFTRKLDENDLTRLNKIFNYLFRNFQNSISLNEISEIANMSPTSFCKYFKERTNKTLVTFLNEIRIGHACKLLIENKDMNVSQICYECGFNNLTNFDIQFKKVKRINPLAFREMYHKW